jgi:pimeloyl-ACP methyl ester carboxylesterase
MYELEPRLRTLAVATLILVGEEEAAAVDASRFLGAAIPGEVLRTLLDTGHMLNLEEPAAFNAAVFEFLPGPRSRAPARSRRTTWISD